MLNLAFAKKREVFGDRPCKVLWKIISDTGCKDQPRIHFITSGAGIRNHLLVVTSVLSPLGLCPSRTHRSKTTRQENARLQFVSGWRVWTNPRRSKPANFLLPPIVYFWPIQAWASIRYRRAEAQVDLPLIIPANRGVSLLFGAGERRQQQRRQNCDNRNHHQEFDEREAIFRF